MSNAKKLASANDGTVPRALHEGTLRFGTTEVPCYVLADGTPLLTSA